MAEIVAYRYRWKDALTWVHSTTEPARHPNLIVEPLCVAGGEKNEALRKALKAVEWWAQQKCPCHEEQPNPCPLCGASVENLESCKAVDSVFPRQLLRDVREALGGSNA